jgi:hypothetical protein
MITEQELDEYWEKSLNQPILEIYDESMQLFQQKLPEVFYEEYAWDDLVLELFWGLTEAKEFQKTLNFIALLQEKQAIIFEELQAYFDDFLITYFLYHQNKEALQEPVQRFIQDPSEDLDYFVKNLHLILFYQQEELTDQMSAPAVYQALESPEDEEEEEYGEELHPIRLYLEIKNQYQLYQQNGTYDWVSIRKKLMEYDLDIPPDYLKELSAGISTSLPDAAALQKLFREDFNKCLLQLEGHFLKSMDSRDFSMLTAGLVWDMLKQYWLVYNLRKNKSGKLLFSFTPADYRKFLNDKSVFGYMELQGHRAALLWGTQLVYDFLLETGMVSEKIHREVLDYLLEEKGFFIAEYQTEIWGFRFVHDWPKPGSMDDVQWETEKEIFSRSYKVTGGYKAHGEQLLQDLNPKNPLLRSIKNGFRKIVTRRQQIEAEMDRSFSGINRNPPFPEAAANLISPQEHSQRQKVGRNEPCPCGSGKKYKKCCGS